MYRSLVYLILLFDIDFISDDEDVILLFIMSKNDSAIANVFSSTMSILPISKTVTLPNDLEEE